jgi:hypothetical protein
MVMVLGSKVLCVSSKLSVGAPLNDHCVSQDALLSSQPTNSAPPPGQALMSHRRFARAHLLARQLRQLHLPPPLPPPLRVLHLLVWLLVMMMVMTPPRALLHGYCPPLPPSLLCHHRQHCREPVWTARDRVVLCPDMTLASGRMAGATRPGCAPQRRVDSCR